MRSFSRLMKKMECNDLVTTAAGSVMPGTLNLEDLVPIGTAPAPICCV
jgi:hypothetical protein